MVGCANDVLERDETEGESIDGDKTEEERRGRAREEVWADRSQLRKGEWFVDSLGD